MKLKGKYSESAVLYAVILSVAAVISIAVFVVVFNIMGGKMPEIGTKPAETTTAASETEAPESQGYEPDRELADEMKDAVISLISDNYTVLRLYYIRGLSHKDEPYGNAPEDGYFSVDSDKYTSLSQIEEKGYDTEMKSKGIQQIQKYGIAFCGKLCKIAANPKDIA